MKPSIKRVLTALRKAKRRGVTFDDFPAGTDLRKRISELLNQYHCEFEKRWEDLSNGGRRRRYILIKEGNICL